MAEAPLPAWRSADKAAELTPLGEAADMDDYSLASDILMDGLGYRDSSQLVTFLQGTLEEVLRRQRKLGEEAQDEEELDDPEEQPDRRLWRLSKAFLFDEEVAMAMLSDLIVEYSSVTFAEAAKTLEREWLDQTPISSIEQIRSVEKLCQDTVLAPVLVHYGFTPDAKGWKEALAILVNLSRTREKLRSKLRQMQGTIYGYFAALGTEGVASK